MMLHRRANNIVNLLRVHEVFYFRSLIPVLGKMERNISNRSIDKKLWRKQIQHHCHKNYQTSITNKDEEAESPTSPSPGLLSVLVL